MMSFIEAKAKGRKPSLKTVTRKRAPKSLAQSLAASITMVKRGKERAHA